MGCDKMKTSSLLFSRIDYQNTIKVFCAHFCISIEKFIYEIKAKSIDISDDDHLL